MPDKDEKVFFKNYHKQQAAPFAIYADFEAILEKVSSCQSNPDNSYTQVYQKHTYCSYGYEVVLL